MATPNEKESVFDRVRRDMAPVARRAGERLGKAFQVTATAARKTSGVVALRTKVSTREVKIRGLFYRIGQAFYRAQKAGKKPSENAASLRPMTDQVDKLNREIASLKQQERKLRAAK